MRVFKSLDSAKRIAMGEVLVPDVFDVQGDCISREEVEKAAYEYMRSSRALGIQHVAKADASTHIVESFIAREGDPLFQPGSWVLAVKCSEELWERVVSGQITGFSVGGKGIRTEV
jgi:hypothetical protein